jgi:hypothetical protein
MIKCDLPLEMFNFLDGEGEFLLPAWSDWGKEHVIIRRIIMIYRIYKLDY